MLHRIIASMSLLIPTMAFGQEAAPGGGADDAPALAAVAPMRNWCGTETNPYGGRAALGGGVWTGGQVYYEFDAAASPAINATEQQNLLNAWGRISAVCGVTFIARAGQANYITITRNTTSATVSFSSSIGMAGGQQFLRIGDSHWVLSGVLIHETMHALGFFHEQQRTDRGAFITVNNASIDPNYIGNYNTTSATLVGNYDFDSLMHYQLDAFVTSGVGMIAAWPYSREWQWTMGRYLLSGAGPGIMDRAGLVSRYGGNAPPRTFNLNAPTFGQRVGSAWNRNLNWFAATGATSYRLMVDDDPYFRSPYIDQTQASTSYTSTSAPRADALYYVHLTASNAAGSAPTGPLTTYMFYTGDSWPATLYVDASAPAGGSGRTWGAAMNDLRIALDLAAAGGGSITEVRVAGGTYRPDSGSGDRTATFWLPRGCVVRGGYAGRGAADPDVRDPSAHPSILSGDLASNDGANFANIGENSLHVVSADGSTAASRLDGFTIRGGNANGVSFYDTWGGGLRMASGSAVIWECIFESNSANLASAAMVDDGAPRFVRCTFRANRSLNNVGAYYAYGGSSSLINCSFLDNTGTYGGGAFAYGGAFSCAGCLFARNAASGGGGGLGVQSANATVTNCTFVGNSALQNGGGLSLYGATALVRNCILSGNTSPSGAQLANGAYGFTGGALTVSNTLSRGGQGAVFLGTSNTLTWGAGNIDADPRFTNSGGGDYSLGPTSPCLDAGSTAALPADAGDLDGDGNVAEAMPLDLANKTRVIFTAVDMGALERQPCVADVDDGSGTGHADGGVTIDDLLYFLGLFAAGDIRADVDDGSGTGTHDGGVTIDDLLYFLAHFAAGC